MAGRAYRGEHRQCVRGQFPGSGRSTAKRAYRRTGGKTGLPVPGTDVSGSQRGDSAGSVQYTATGREYIEGRYRN
ncbi:hypothetical protein D3C71_2012170 [compost metagenome]